MKNCHTLLTILLSALLHFVAPISSAYAWLAPAAPNFSGFQMRSRANVPLKFSVVDNELDHRECLSDVIIQPAAALSLPLCGNVLMWHDGSSYKFIKLESSHVYELSWDQGSWIVKDVTTALQ